MGTVHTLVDQLLEQPLPGGLNLSPEEVQDAAGGYVYPARQLRELHARGFVLATLGRSGQVVLPRAHYQAVLNGQFRREADIQPPRAPARPNRAKLMDRFSQNRKS